MKLLLTIKIITKIMLQTIEGAESAKCAESAKSAECAPPQKNWHWEVYWVVVTYM